MAESILINFTPQETRVAILEQGIVQELHVERHTTRGLVGNIYLGRVVRILPGMQSAFVDVGLERTAFLHVADIWQARVGDVANREYRPIEEVISEGQTLLVQVIKDPIGTKGARLSTQVSIAGRMLVYLPQEKHIGISQRIDEAEREALRERLTRLVPEDEAGGFILRTIAETADEKSLQDDINYLRKIWAGLKQQISTSAVPSLMYQDLSLAQRVLRDFANPETERILVDSRETFQKLKDFAAIYVPGITGLLEHYNEDRTLFDLYGVEEEIQRALSRRVDLKSGGYLIIDQTEAMTTVDVNTGAFVGVRNFDETIFKTNLEAAQAIARQLRLRNLGGIIILDFIDMDHEAHQEAVLAELRKCLSRDHMRMTVNGFTALGLVEMTRKRTRESLARVLCETCPTCDGRGQVKTARTVCYEILRELVRESRQFEAREYRVIASQKVVDLFLEEEEQALAMASDFIGKPIPLQGESGYGPEQHDIVLL